MSPVQLPAGFGAVVEDRAPRQATRAGTADRSSEAHDRDDSEDRRTRRRLELAAFPAVFLTLLGAPAEAEMPEVPIATPVAVPTEDEGSLNLAELASMSRQLGDYLVAEEGERGASFGFGELADRIAAAEGDDDLEAVGALVHDFNARLLSLTDVALPHDLEAIGGILRGEGGAVRPASADTLAGWGFNPEFRDRLSRVVDRMRTEHGLDVEVIEGFRDQARQNDLWSQGRTRPGPVVTWTKDSRHTVGAAADLTVDGSWVKGRGALLLARIASEEGLRTLGPKDPGHIELPGPFDRLAAEAETLGLEKRLEERFRTVETGTPANAGKPTRGIARVAPVAPVAPVAAVARPGGATPLADASPAPAAAPDESDEKESGTESATDRPTTSRHAGASFFGSGASASGGLERWVRRIGDGVPGLEMMRRIDAAQSTAPQSPFRRVMIALEGADAAEVGRIRLDVRGERVDALFEIDDAHLARRVERDMASLRTRLASEGIDPGRMRVRTATAGDAVLGSDLRVDASRQSAGSEAGRHRGGEGQAQRDLNEQRRGFRDQQPTRRDTEPEEES